MNGIYEKDKQTIYEAYCRLPACIKGKKINKNGYGDKRMRLIQKADQVMFANIGFLSSDRERERVIRAGKDTYLEYCKFVVGNEDADNPQLRSRVDKMLEKLSGIEAAELSHFRKTNQNGFQPETDTILADERWLAEMVSEDVVTVIRHAMAEKEAGKGYSDGKIEFSATTAHMTIFVDESRRANPGVLFEPDQAKLQNVISYVICNGAVPDENEISKENVLEEGVFQTEDVDNLCYALYEAFAKFMIKVATRNFAGTLTIFTDSSGACEGWKKIRGLNYLAEQFEEVRVVKIPREKNTYADKLGRDKALLLIGKKELEEKMAQVQELEKLKKEMAFVKEYFPNPKVMLPALLEELRLMAGEEADHEVC